LSKLLSISSILSGTGPIGVELLGGGLMANSLKSLGAMRVSIGLIQDLFLMGERTLGMYPSSLR
jgi:hypothetical protein